VTFRIRLLTPSRSSLSKALALGPAIGQALQVSSVRVTDSSRGILVEVPSPLPRTPGADLLSKSSKGLAIAVGLDSFRRPVFLDFERWPHLLLVGPSGRGKSQALRSLLLALAHQNAPERVVCLILAKKLEDWRAFQPASCCSGLLIQPEEQKQALSWLAGDLLQERAEQGKRWPQVFLLVDDLGNVSARADITSHLGEIASLGRAAGIHLLLSTQTTGKAGGLSQDIEQNMTARLIFGAADAAAGARHAGSGGLQVESVGRSPGDALLILDSQPQRVATGFCQDTSVALLPAGSCCWLSEQLKTIRNSQEQPEQRRTGLQEVSSKGLAVSQEEEDRPEHSPEQAEQNRPKLDATRPPAPTEKAWIRYLYRQTGSKKQTVLSAYGHYNGKVFAYVTQALKSKGGQHEQ